MSDRPEKKRRTSDPAGDFLSRLAIFQATVMARTTQEESIGAGSAQTAQEESGGASVDAHTSGHVVDSQVPDDQTASSAKRAASAAKRAGRRLRDQMTTFDPVNFVSRGGQIPNTRKSALTALSRDPDTHGYIGLCAEAEGGFPRLIAFKTHSDPCNVRWILAAVEDRIRVLGTKPRLYLSKMIDYPDEKTLVAAFDDLSTRAKYPIVVRYEEALDYAAQYVISVAPPESHRWTPGCYWVARTDTQSGREEVDHIWHAPRPNRVLDEMGL